MSVKEVVHNARCELYDAVKENRGKYPWIDGWAAQFTFTFAVERDANLSTDASYLIPVELGAFTLGLKASLKQKARGTYSFAFKILKGLQKFLQANCVDNPDGAHDPRRLLAGEIGLRRWINEVVPHIHDARIDNAQKGEKKSEKTRRLTTGEITDLGYTIEFFVTADGTLTPSWALTYPNKRQFKPSFGVMLSEVDTHRLIVAMTPLSVKAPSPEDMSGILALNEQGAYEIIGRRVCLITSSNPGACPDEEPEAKAKADKRAALTKVEDAKRNFTALVPDEFKHIPLSRLMELDKGTTLSDKGTVSERMMMTWSRDNKALARELKDAAALLKEAQAEAKNADKALEAAKAFRGQRLSAARAAAAAEAENEASRRLDLITQQQILNRLSTLGQ